MKRASPVILHQRPGGGMPMYNDMNEDMMYPTGPSSSGSNERNLTPLSRRNDEGS
jgi:hypothetical protein